MKLSFTYSLIVLLTIITVLGACTPTPTASPADASDNETRAAVRNLPTDQVINIILTGERERQEFLAGRANKWQGPFPVGDTAVSLERVLPLAEAVYRERGGTLPLSSEHQVGASPSAPSSPSPAAPQEEEEALGPDPQARFFTHTINDVRKESVSITTKNPDTNFEERTAQYDAYFIPGETFRIICQQPCVIPENILKKKVVGADAAIRALIDLTDVDVLPILEPVDIHLSSSVECGNYQEKLSRNGYVSRFSGSRPSGVPGVTTGSYMCLWEFDDEQLILPLTEENALRIEAQAVLVHEYSHILFYRRSFASPEGFVQTLQMYVSGAWDGEGRSRNNFPRMTDACNPLLQTRVPDVYALCSRCGFQMQDFRIILQRVHELYSRGEGAAVEGKVSVPQLKQIIDGITGKDSVAECGVDWLGYAE
ncbi:hypothetical protein HYU22_03265 [Candidatus Woesearchaeota archaeon]|nr:hypothetical protein [Candidatus Woesearchaeota archaeon]